MRKINKMERLVINWKNIFGTRINNKSMKKKHEGLLLSAMMK